MSESAPESTPIAPTPPEKVFGAGLGYLLGGILALVLLYALYAFWSQTGPFAWLAGVQDSLLGGVAAKLTFIFYLIIVMIPVGLLGGLINRCEGKGMLVAIAPVALVVGFHLLLTLFLLIKGGSPGAPQGLADHLKQASFISHEATFNTADLVKLDLANAATISSGRVGSSTTSTGDVYVLFDRSAWPDPGTPVYVKTTKGELESVVDQPTFPGTISKGPIPFLARKNLNDLPSPIGVVIEPKATVRGTMMGPAFGYGGLLIFALYLMFKGAKG